MSNSSGPNRKMSPRSSGFFSDIANRFQLVARLIADSRVSPLLKILPISTLIYLIVPADLMPLLPFDDAMVIWLGTSLFVEMVPQHIVDEHLQLLYGVMPGRTPNQRNAAGSNPGDVIDGEFFDVDQNKRP